MSTPEEYLCTSRQSSSHSLASSAWAQTSSQNQQPPNRHPTQLALMEHEFGVKATSPFIRRLFWSGRRQFASVRPSISKDKDLLVSGDIFNESSGKYVIAEANRMPSYGKSTHLNYKLDRETLSPHSSRIARFSSEQRR